MPLKKLWCLWLCLFALLFSCRKTKKVVDKDIWIDYRKAYSFVLNKQTDSAFYYFNKVVSNSVDSLPVAMAYTNMSISQSDAGDFYGALESASKSLIFSNETDIKYRTNLASTYNELGLNSDNLKNFNDAITYYDKSLKYTDDPEAKLITLNNKAYIYYAKKDREQALTLFSDVIEKSKPYPATYAMILTNLAITKASINSSYNAVPDFLKALNIRQNNHDLTGQSSSYGHLADYYSRLKPDSALFYARVNYDFSLKIKSPDGRLQALKRLIQLSPVKDFKRYFASYEALSDSLQIARNAAKNQFAVIRYDVEKSKADNLKLQKNNSEAKYQLIKERILLWSAIFLFMAGAIFAMLWYKKRKLRLEWDAQNTIRENQLKISKKVHDVVANGLYRIMAEIENQKTFNKNKLLDNLEDMYEKSRDISYEQIQQSQHFHQKISELLTSFATENTKILFAGNNAELWENIGTNIRHEVEHILQELLVNMKKHSKASSVVIRFEEKNNSINIFYTDDGIGMPEKIIYKNGLTNTGNRINLLNGIITFDTRQQKGLKIFISFPVT